MAAPIPFVHRIATLLIIGVSTSTLVLAKPAPEPIPVPPPPTSRPAEPAPTTLKQMLAATRVDFQCNNLAAFDAVVEMENAVGFALRRASDFKAGAPGRVKIEAKKEPLISIVSQLCQQTGMRINMDDPRASSPFYLSNINNKNSDTFYVPRQIDSSVMPFVSAITVNRDGPKNSDKYRLRLRVDLAMEPKVYVVGYVPAIDIDLAQDDLGRSLIILNKQGKPEVTTEGKNVDYPSRRYSTQVGCDIHYPTAPASTIKRIRGALKVVFGFNIQTHDASAALEDGKVAQVPMVHNAVLTFSDFGPDPKNERNFLMTMSVTRVRLPSGEFIEQSPEFHAIRMEASSGESRLWNVSHDGMRLSQNGQAQCTVKIWPDFAVNDKDAKTIHPEKFSVTVPGRVEGTVIPFELADIPVPAIKKK